MNKKEYMSFFIKLEELKNILVTKMKYYFYILSILLGMILGVLFWGISK